MVSSSRACKLLHLLAGEQRKGRRFYHPTWNVKIGLSRRGRFSLTLFTTSSIKLSGLKKSWSFSKASLGSFSIRIFHSGTSRSPLRLEPDFAFDFGGMSIAAITQAIASIPTNSPFVSFFLFIFFKFYWFIDGDRIVICSFFSRRKAEKVWWSRAVWWGGEEMDCHASLAMAVKLSFWVKRSRMKNIEYVILCPFRWCRNALFFELRYYYVQEEIFFELY